LTSQDIKVKKNWFLDIFKNKKKRLWLIVTIVALILLAGAGYDYYYLTHKIAPTLSQNTTTAPTTPTATAPAVQLYPAVLDGVMTTKDASQAHPLAIIVENQVDSRPQSGLSKASVVYEAIAEGGITRFLAVFGENSADKVGPVRSVRTYFVDWAHGLSAFIAHVGGNMDALDKIQSEHSYDLDQFAYSSPYWREYAAGLATEHTMYTSTTKLRDQATKNGYPTANNFTQYKYKDDPTGAAKDALPTSQKIKVNFGTDSEYNVVFDYDKTTNSYLRSQAGAPHIDRMTKTQLNPKNVVVMTVKRVPTVTRINEKGYIMTTVGSGAAKIFIDGKEIDGTWKKDSTASRELFYDASGQEITFDRGQLWISIIPAESTSSVTVL
jgi:hypothetical protein